MTHDTQESLLPCPFCGGIAKRAGGGRYDGHARVQCTMCACSVALEVSDYHSDDEWQEQVDAKWNTRASEAQPRMLGEDVAVELMCKAYDAEVDYLGDSAYERYCNDVPMRRAYQALLSANALPLGDE